MRLDLEMVGLNLDFYFLPFLTPVNSHSACEIQ